MDGDCALFWAIEKGDIELIQLLLNNEADVNIIGRGGRTPLKVARRYGNPEIIQFLIENGAIDTL
jgi:ankyrin repeat protein